MTTFQQIRSELVRKHNAAVLRQQAAFKAKKALAADRRALGAASGEDVRRYRDLDAQVAEGALEARHLGEQLAAWDAQAADQAAWETRSRQVHDVDLRPPSPRAYDQVARIGYEPRVYSAHTDPTGRSFLIDVGRNALHNDPSASERLARHMAEERVERTEWFAQVRAAGDATTGAFAGLTVPQYLTDLYAPQISTLRPFADACTHKYDLPPEGMALDISRITTGSSVALQANELDPVSSTSLDDTLLTVPVQTIAGQQRVSRQAVERGTGVEGVVLQDLMRKYAVTLDNTLLNQATTGLAAVAQTVTFTSATPDIPGFLGAIGKANSLLEQALMGVAVPTHLVVHSRRWHWMSSQTSTAWPVVSGQAVPPQSTAAMITSEYGPAVRAVLPNGLKVVVDNNVSTAGGQDDAFVVAADESMWLAETPNAPLQIRAEQPAAPNLGILYVLYGYMAYWSRYTNPASRLTGTGMAAPAGY
jgi:hypothetical protein